MSFLSVEVTTVIVFSPLQCCPRAWLLHKSCPWLLTPGSNWMIVFQLKKSQTKRIKSTQVRVSGLGPGYFSWYAIMKLLLENYFGAYHCVCCTSYYFLCSYTFPTLSAYVTVAVVDTLCSVFRVFFCLLIAG